MMKKYQKPVVAKKEQNRVHSSICGWNTSCGSQVRHTK